MSSDDIFFNVDKNSTDPVAQELKKLYKDDEHFIKKIEDIMALFDKGDVGTVYCSGPILRVEIRRAE